MFWQWGGLWRLSANPLKWRVGSGRVILESGSSVILRPDPFSRLFLPLRQFDARDLRVVELLPGFIAVYGGDSPYVVSSHYRSLRRLVEHLDQAGARAERRFGGNWFVPWIPALAVVAGIAAAVSASLVWYFVAAAAFGIGPPLGAVYAALLASRSVRS